MKETTSTSQFEWEEKTFNYTCSIGLDLWAFIEAQNWPTKPTLTAFITQHPALVRPLSLLEYFFHDDQLLIEALTHRSFLNECRGEFFPCYERLEFLGDSVLSVLISTYLVQHFPGMKEGELSRFRSSLVNSRSFADLTQFLGLGNCLILGRGELHSGGQQKEAILCDVLESLLGAIYRDGGFEAASKSFFALLDAFKLEKGWDFFRPEQVENFDSKTQLQELTMKEFKLLPEYRSHQLEDKSFLIEVWIGEEQVLEGTYSSKKKGEQELASRVLSEELLVKLKRQEPSC